jgi:gliding motility-associated-like protein
MKKILVLLCGVMLSVYGNAQSAAAPFAHSLLNGPNTRTDFEAGPAYTLPSDSLSWTGTTPAGICPGGTITITALQYSTGSTFQWTLNGAPIPGATSDSYTANTSGDYSVEVTDALSTLTVWPTLTVGNFTLPTASFTFAPNGQCSSTPIQFTNTSPGVSTYLWYFADPNAGVDSISTATDPLHYFLGAAVGGNQTFPVQLTATNAEGCSASVTHSVATTSPSTNLGGSGLTIFNGNPVFTSCTSTGASLTFVNNSTTSGTNIDYTIIWGDLSPNFTATSFANTNHFYSSGTYTLQFIVSGAGNCRDTGFYSVYIGSNPAVGLSNPGNTVTCSESSLTFPITSTGTNSPGTTYTVTFNDATPAIVFQHPAPASVSHMFNLSSCGTTSSSGATTYPNSFSATIRASNPCGASSASVVPIYISKKPKAAVTYSPNDTVCTNVSVNFTNASGNMQSVNNGVCTPGKVIWKIIPATGWTFTGNMGNDLNSTDPGLWTTGSNSMNIVFTTPGNYIVRLKVGNTSLCNIDSFDTPICVSPQAVADFTLSSNAGCGPLAVSTTNLSNPSNCGTNKYDWTVSYANPATCEPNSSNWVFTGTSTTNSPNPDFNFINPGVYTVQLVTTDPGLTCFSTVSKVLTVKAKPNVIFDPIAPICQGDYSPIATINNCFSSTTETYLWTFTGSVPLTSVSATPTVNYANTGNFNIQIAVTNECGTTTVAQPVTVNPTPSLNQPANLVICNTATAPTTVFTSSLPGITYTWTNDNASIGLPSSGSGDLPSFGAINTGNTAQIANIVVTPVSNTCTGPTKTFTITVNPTPPINAGPDMIICNASSVTMAAVLAPGTTGVWDQIPASTTTIVTPSSPTTVINGLVANTTYQFRWTVTGTGICPTVRDTVTVLNRPLPGAASAGNDTLICGYIAGNPNIITMNGNAPTHIWELGTWTIVPGSNTLGSSPAIVSPNTFNTLVTGLLLGTGVSQGSIVLQWSISNDGGCPATSDQMTVTVVRQPTAGTLAPNAELCYGSNTTITATGFDGSVIKWRRQDAPLLTNPYNDIPGNTTPTLNLTNLLDSVSIQFIVGAVNPLCLQRDTAVVIIPVSAMIVNDINGRVDSVCPGALYNTGNFLASGGNNTPPSYQWQISDDGIVFANIPTFTLSDYTFNPDHTVWLRRLVTIGACSSISDTIKVWVEPAITNNIIAADQIICVNATPVTITGTVPTAGGGAIPLSYQWESSSDNILFSSIVGATSQNYSPGALSQTTYYRRVVRSSRCATTLGGVSDTVTITITPIPVASFVPSSLTGCSPLTVNFANNTPGIGNTYTWNFGDPSSGANNTSGLTTPSHTYTTGTLQTYTVSLLAQNLCGADTRNISITVQPNSVNLNLTVSAPQLAGCAPHTVKFYSSSPGSNNFTWNFGDLSPTVNTTSPIDSIVHVYNAPGVYVATLRGINGCSDTTGNITITVYGKPVPLFTPSATQVCVGAPVSFANNSTGATNYLWRFNDAAATTTAVASPTFSWTTPGIYLVRLIAYNVAAGGTVTCADSVDANIEVLATQTGSMTTSATTSTCAPLTVTFTNNTVPASSVLWNFGDGSPTSNLNTLSHTFTQSGTYVVTLTVTTPAGCQYVTTQNIQVNGPSGTLQYVGGYKCNNQSVHFEVIGNGAATYTWNMGDGSASVTNASPTFDYTYPVPGSFTPTVTLTGGGCNYPITGAVPVRPDRILAGFTTATSQSCGSTSITFTDTSSTFFGAAQTKWTFSNGNVVLNSATTTQVFNTSTLLHVILEITGVSGCVVTRELDIPVTVWNNPIVTLVPPPGNTGCARQPVTFTAIVNSADPVVNIDWITSNLITGSGLTFSPVFGSAGSYTAQLSVSTVNGCASVQTSPSITINPSPTVSIADPAPICRGGSTNLVANATGATGLQWSPANGLSCTTCPNPSANPLFTTPYIVTASNAFGCTASDTATVTVTQPLTMTVIPLSDSICLGDSIFLLVSGGENYVWTTQPSVFMDCTTCDNPVWRPTLPGFFSATVTGSNSCFTQTLTVPIGVGDIPSINLGPDLLLATGTIKPLISTVTGGPIVNWLWSPATDLSCTTCPQPSVTVRTNQTYSVIGTTGFGCSTTDTLTIHTFCESLQAFIPNAFTPDGDGINDILMVRGTGIVQVKSFRVFNRWGETVYERANFPPNDPSFGWDGKVKGIVSQPDVYLYTAEVICENGITYTYKGNVSVLK